MSPPPTNESAKLTYKELFHKLWDACQGLDNATSTLKKDYAWAESNPERAYPTGKKGHGEAFATYMAARRLSYEDFLAFREVADEIKSHGIKPTNLIDKRK